MHEIHLFLNRNHVWLSDYSCFSCVCVSMFTYVFRLIILLHFKSTNCLLDISIWILHGQQKLSGSKAQHIESPLNTLFSSIISYFDEWFHHPPIQSLKVETWVSSLTPLLSSFSSAPNQLPGPSFLHPKYILNQSLSFHFTENALQATMLISRGDLYNSLVSRVPALSPLFILYTSVRVIFAEIRSDDFTSLAKICPLLPSE